MQKNKDSMDKLSKIFTTKKYEEYCNGIKSTAKERLEKATKQINMIPQNRLQNVMSKDLYLIDDEDINDDKELKKKKKKNDGTRIPYNKNQVSVLSTWIENHQTNPYPNRSDKNQLSKDTFLDHNQISNWFSNWRKRKWNKDLTCIDLDEEDT
eukprot:TRINITY_DN685_c0_g1_i1.p1 TRINITY_DN685_c0_g1~~TRINITY_DN685_c0_g1_i1.p1  ORF type:complete len:169 (-),score=44.01 TRINITY_DN685_c0_g1_i1:174-632(-)